MLTARQLNRATLARQLLLERQALDPVQAMRHMVALQAQEPASPYVAMWNRLDGFDPAQLDAAFADAAMIKASLMRITLHAVTTEDYPAFHAAMVDTLRAARLNDKRFKETGLSVEDADDLIPQLRRFVARPRSKADIEGLLERQLGAPPSARLWWALRTYAPIRHAPTGEPWSFKVRADYLAAPRSKRVPTDAATQHLVRRYLEGFGPATAQDVGQFSLLRMSTVRPALEAMEDELVTLEGPGGAVLFDIADGAIPDGDTPAPPRLLAMWDSILLAYADRSRVIPDDYRSTVIRINGDVLPTVLVDGYVAGVWRPLDGGVEVTAFEKLSRATWQALEGEAASLVTLLAGRDPDAYSRYGNWWPKLPSTERRTIGV